MRFHFKKRITQLRRAMAQQGLDCFALMTAEGNNPNVYYLSGFSGTTGALAISKNGAVLAVDPRYTVRAKQEASGVDVIEIPRGISQKHHVLYIAEAIKALGLTENAKIGIEGAQVSHAALLEWNRASIGFLVPTEHIVERLRQVKDPEEIRAIASAARATSRVFEAVSRKIRAGMTEEEIARLIDITLIKNGAVGPSFRTIVASGTNSATPHHETGKRAVKKGEPLILDFGGVYQGGYCSDLTRTIFVPGKKPLPRLREMYRIVLEANKKAHRALKPGMIWKEYDAVARKHIEEEGYGKYFSHGVGHSIGLQVHDPYDYAHDAFVAGVVLSNEPGIYIPDVGGIRIEDDVVVTKTGARRLTDAPYLKI